MTHTHDCKYSALVAYGTPVGQINDMELFWLNDITTGIEKFDDINDQWYDLLVSAGIAPTQLNDMQFEWLGDMGWDGNTLPDKWNQFWCIGGGAVLGSEEITDPTFDTPGDWFSGAGWTVAGGVATCDGTQVGDSDLSNTGSSAVLAVAYQVRFEIVSYTSGGVTPTIFTTDGTQRSSVGTFVETIISPANGPSFALEANATFVGVIDNFSVREILA